MNAYLINPFAHTVTQVEHDGNWRSIGPVINADTFAVARFNARGDAVYVDDEGLISGKPQCFFTVRGYPQPLAGMGLVLGCDDEGDSCAPSVKNLETMRKLVSFVTPIKLNGEIVFLQSEAP